MNLFEDPQGPDYVRGETLLRIAGAAHVPSTNNLYRLGVVSRPGRQPFAKQFLTTPGKAFKKAVARFLLANGVRPIALDGRTPLYVSVAIHRPDWWSKPKRKADRPAIKKIDVFNLEKALLDAICPVLGLRDEWIFDGRIRKVEDPVEGFTVEIGTLVLPSSLPVDTLWRRPGDTR